MVDTQYSNALAAASVGHILEESGRIATTLSSVEPRRSVVKYFDCQGLHGINDSYNSNPKH